MYEGIYIQACTLHLQFIFRINAFTESGMIEKWKRRYYPFDRCTMEAASKAKLPDPANIQDTQGAIFVLGLGLGMGACFLVVELAIRRIHIRVFHRQRFDPSDPGYAPNSGRVPTLATSLRDRLFHMGMVAGGVVRQGGTDDTRGVSLQSTYSSGPPNSIEEVSTDAITVLPNGFAPNRLLHRKSARPPEVSTNRLSVTSRRNVRGSVKQTSQQNGVTRNGSVYNYKF